MTANTVQLHTVEWDKGKSDPAMVLLHGLANRWQAMAPLIPELARQWRVLAPDLRGHGRSPRADRYTVGLCALDVAAFMEERGLGPVVVYGHSLGGLVGLVLAAEFPDAVRAVIVGDSAVLVRPEGSSIGGVPESAIRLAEAGGPLPKSVDPAVMSAFVAGQLLRDYDGPDVLCRVRCPVLLLRGSTYLGAHLSGRDAERALSLLSDGRQAELPGVGHQLQITAPGPVMAAMRPFLNEVQRRIPAGVRVP